MQIRQTKIRKVSGYVFICVKRIQILPLTILLLNFGTVTMVWYYFLIW